MTEVLDMKDIRVGDIVEVYDSAKQFWQIARITAWTLFYDADCSGRISLSGPWGIYQVHSSELQHRVRRIEDLWVAIEKSAASVTSRVSVKELEVRAAALDEALCKSQALVHELQRERGSGRVQELEKTLADTTKELHAKIDLIDKMRRDIIKAVGL